MGGRNQPIRWGWIELGDQMGRLACVILHDIEGVYDAVPQTGRATGGLDQLRRSPARRRRVRGGVLAMEILQQPELIRDLPVSIRPIARLETLGAEALKESELLALAMRSLSMRKPEELLSRHSVKELLGMPWARLASLRGMGHAGAAALLASAELVRRTMNQVDTGRPVLQSVSDVAAQAIEIRDKKKEYLLAFFLNARHQLIAREVISIGTLTAFFGTSKRNLRAGHRAGGGGRGASYTTTHQGIPRPRDEDVRLTKRIAQAGQIMGIELLDHVILAQSGTYSFKTQSQGGL